MSAEPTPVGATSTTSIPTSSTREQISRQAHSRSAEFTWQHERGITSFFMHDVREIGIRDVISRAIGIVGDGPVFLSVDVDVLDPAFAPGTGTPEPGGMTSIDLLWACRQVGERVELCGMDVVEVAPTQIGSADITALVADRIVREALTGVATRKLGSAR